MTTRTLASQTTSDVGFLSWKDGRRTEQLEVGDFISVGRDVSNHVVFDDGFVSSKHMRLERKPNGFLVRDLRSRNGTYVNGARIYEALLNDGDRVRVGQTEMLFTWERPSLSPTHNLTSRNPQWKVQLERLPGIAMAEFPVLLTGPSGTGKDVMAQAIHQHSSRKGGPFISVNCSALSEALVESELFGHVRGSFTGATGDRKGAFEAARRGTLFLDEIGDLPLALQPKLLRALENNQIRPVGSDRAVETDVRIVAATHHDLKRLVLEQKFRSDLYFRLHVIQIQMPSLCERIEDFDDLFYGFARAARVRFSYAAIERLKMHSWPGNIRELRNVISRAKAYWDCVEIGEADIAQLIDVLPGGEPQTTLAFKPGRSVIKEIELEMIKSRLIANHGNQRRTAADLGMAKSTLHDRIRVYGIDVERLLLEKGKSG